MCLPELTSDDTSAAQHPETSLPRCECGASKRSEGGTERAALNLRSCNSVLLNDGPGQGEASL